jgi:hypothetical protein
MGIIMRDRMKLQYLLRFWDQSLGIRHSAIVKSESVGESCERVMIRRS